MRCRQLSAHLVPDTWPFLSGDLYLLVFLSRYLALTMTLRQSDYPSLSFMCQNGLIFSWKCYFWASTKVRKPNVCTSLSKETIFFILRAFVRAQTSPLHEQIFQFLTCKVQNWVIALCKGHSRANHLAKKTEMWSSSMKKGVRQDAECT